MRMLGGWYSVSVDDYDTKIAATTGVALINEQENMDAVLLQVFSAERQPIAYPRYNLFVSLLDKGNNIIPCQFVIEKPDYWILSSVNFNVMLPNDTPSSSEREVAPEQYVPEQGEITEKLSWADLRLRQVIPDWRVGFEGKIVEQNVDVTHRVRTYHHGFEADDPYEIEAPKEDSVAALILNEYLPVYKYVLDYVNATGWSKQVETEQLRGMSDDEIHKIAIDATVFFDELNRVKSVFANGDMQSVKTNMLNYFRGVGGDHDLGAKVTVALYEYVVRLGDDMAIDFLHRVQDEKKRRDEIKESKARWEAYRDYHKARIDEMADTEMEQLKAEYAAEVAQMTQKMEEAWAETEIKLAETEALSRTLEQQELEALGKRRYRESLEMPVIEQRDTPLLDLLTGKIAYDMLTVEPETVEKVKTKIKTGVQNIKATDLFPWMMWR